MDATEESPKPGAEGTTQLSRIKYIFKKSVSKTPNIYSFIPKNQLSIFLHAMMVLRRRPPSLRQPFCRQAAAPSRAGFRSPACRPGWLWPGSVEPLGRRRRSPGDGSAASGRQAAPAPPAPPKKTWSSGPLCPNHWACPLIKQHKQPLRRCGWRGADPGPDKRRAH